MRPVNTKNILVMDTIRRNAILAELAKSREELSHHLDKAVEGLRATRIAQLIAEALKLDLTAAVPGINLPITAAQVNEMAEKLEAEQRKLIELLAQIDDRLRKIPSEGRAQ